jgi:hypothetical protein
LCFYTKQYVIKLPFKACTKDFIINLELQTCGTNFDINLDVAKMWMRLLETQTCLKCRCLAGRWKFFFIIATTDVYNIKIVYITGQIYAITDMQCIITKIKKHQQIQLFTNNLYKLMSTTKNFLTKILNNIHFKRYTNTWNLTKLDEMNKKNIHKYIFQ